jgi:hypothetical protein
MCSEDGGRSGGAFAQPAKAVFFGDSDGEIQSDNNNLERPAALLFVSHAATLKAEGGSRNPETRTKRLLPNFEDAITEWSFVSGAEGSDSGVAQPVHGEAFSSIATPN